MPSYVAFLRAINLGPTRRLPMAALKTLLADAGYQDVRTHLATGNVLLTSGRRSVERLAAELERLIEADRGFEVPTVVLTPAQLAEVAEDCDRVDLEFGAPEHGHYVELLRTDPSPADRQLIENASREGQRSVVRRHAVHLLLDLPYHRATPPSSALKKAYGISTNRNATVIRTLARNWT